MDESLFSLFQLSPDAGNPFGLRGVKRVSQRDGRCADPKSATLVGHGVSASGSWYFSRGHPFLGNIDAAHGPLFILMRTDVMCVACVACIYANSNVHLCAPGAL